MSVFRPSARIDDPEGRAWEIYTFRIKLPERGALDSSLSEDLDPTRAGMLRLPFAILMLPFLIGAAIIRAFVSLFDVAAAGIHALSSDQWTVEAVSWAPFQSRYTWTTTREYRGQVLAQVEGGLARGEMPRPRNAQLVRVV